MPASDLPPASRLIAGRPGGDAASPHGRRTVRANATRQDGSDANASTTEPLYALGIRPIWRFVVKQGPVFWLVLLYAFFEYVRPQQIYPVLDFVPWSKIIVPLGVALHLFQGNGFRWGVTEGLLALFTLIVVLSSVMAVYPEESFAHIDVYFQWMVIYLLITNTVTTERRFLVFLIFYLLWSFKMARSASWSWAMDGFAFRAWGAAGAPGWFENSGELGIQMCIYVALLSNFINGLKRHWNRTKLLLAWGALGMGFVAIVATSSRGSELAGVCVVLWLVLKSKHRVRGLVWAVVLALIIAAILPPEQIERMQASGTDGTSINRKIYWAEGLDIASQNPALGIGYNNWAPYHKVHYGFIALPHNIFIEAAAQLGYPGVLTFVALIICTLLVNRQTRLVVKALGDQGLFMMAMATGLDAALVAFVVAGYFVTVLFYPYFWINLAMTVALNRAAQNAVAIARSPTAGRRAPHAVRKRTGFRIQHATQANKDPLGGT